MSLRQTPFLATWALEHLVPAGCNESLEGDLLEEFESGRSSSWYCRQALSIVAITWRGEIVDHRMALVFAALWSVLAPAWLGLVYTRDFRSLMATAQRLDWPWSGICPVSLWLSMVLIFLWAGILLFFRWSQANAKHFSPRRCRRGFLRGTLILMPVWIATFALRVVLPPSYWLTTVSCCIPFCVAILCAIWNPSRNTDAPGVHT